MGKGHYPKDCYALIRITTIKRRKEGYQMSKIKEMIKYFDGYGSPYDGLIIALAELEISEKQNDTETVLGTWTPVSKELPPKDDTYLVTMDGAICGVDEPIISMCGYENGKWDEEGYVIAWMPMPEVYGRTKNEES